MKHKFPAFENEDVFAMCVRLRRAHRITRELDDMIGSVLFAIVRLAVAINLRRADAYLEELERLFAFTRIGVLAPAPVE